jgi:hypothetical protein
MNRVLRAILIALLDVVERRDRRLAGRVGKSTLALLHEYAMMRVDPSIGPLMASEIAIAVLHQDGLGAGPTRQPRRDAERDAQMVRLRDELFPLFSRAWPDLADRDRAVCSTIERVTGHPFLKDHRFLSASDVLTELGFGDAARQSRRAVRHSQEVEDLDGQIERWTRIVQGSRTMSPPRGLEADALLSAFLRFVDRLPTSPTV